MVGLGGDNLKVSGLIDMSYFLLVFSVFLVVVGVAYFCFLGAPEIGIIDFIRDFLEWLRRRIFNSLLEVSFR